MPSLLNTNEPDCNFLIDSRSQTHTQYNVGYWTPFLKRIEPLASTFEETVTMAGDLFAAGFDDPDSPEEDGQDFYTRILIGGRVCSNFNENGTK